MDFPSFLSKENKPKNQMDEQDKKIEFSQKLSAEDKEDLPKQAPNASGSFNSFKKEKKTPSVSLKEEKFRPTQKLADTSKKKDKVNGQRSLSQKEVLSEKKTGFFGLFKKKDSVEMGSGNALDVNLVRGEIVKYFDWEKGLLILFISIFSSFIILAFVYWGISWWGSKIEYTKNPFLVQTYFKLNKEIKALDSDIEGISRFKGKIQLVSDLINNHIYWTNYFELLEDLTLSQVYFDNFSGSITGSYALSAHASDFDAIDFQIKNFIANKYIKGAQVNSGVISGSGGEDGGVSVSFDLNFLIDPVLFVK